MEFAIGLVFGVIIGILLALVAGAVMIYFKKVVEQKVTVIEKNIATSGPRPQGYIFEPESEADSVRNEIIEKNRREGRDTKLEDLQ